MNKRQSKKKLKRDLNGLWARLGFIIQLSQMIEYNLLNILAGDKYLEGIEELSLYDFDGYSKATKDSNDVLKDNKESTLGKLLNKAVKEGIFNDEFVKLLEDVVEKRNYYTHQFFKDQLGSNILETNPSYFYKNMSETISLFYEVNNTLLEIDKNYRRVAPQ